jgi:predicted ATP-grasp superfamily ATP-dependent carboligase
VLGVASEPHALGLYSRYLWKAVRRTDGDQEFVGQLKHLAKAYGPSVVMAISENDINLLNRHRDEFADVALLIPEPAKMAIVLDKARTRQLADSIGIPVPRVWPVASVRDFQSLRQQVSFPVVLKWGDPLSVASALEAAGLPLDKFKYCEDWIELSRYLGQFAPLGVFPIVQDYCPGYGLGQSVFMHAGEPLLIFQHRRIHEWPPEGGFSTLCEGVSPSEHAELQRKTVALLQAIGWEGAAMVEYRYDPVSRQARLMEINGRFWGSLPLASYSGAEFGWLTYAVLGLKTAAEPAGVKAGLRCRALVTEAKRLARILFFPEKIQDKRLRFSGPKECLDFIADCLRPGTKYFVFSWTDPKPAICDLGFAVWRRLRALASRKD